jgi:hypothetical protein
MGSDRARVSYDQRRQYRAVVSQMGRVTAEADPNEASTIADEAIREDALDFVGPNGTPNDGFRVVETTKANTGKTPKFDFSVSAGTMYVGGERIVAFDPIRYSSQADWLDWAADPTFLDPSQTVPGRLANELIYLYLEEREVSAVEDTALLEIALGGPDTTQRIRLLQRVKRFGTNASDCASALKDLTAAWLADGLGFDPTTMRLASRGTLGVGFTTQGITTNLCEPDAQGGYLGADNQLIRVQISAFDPKTSKAKLVWGYDNASALYRIDTVANTNIVTLHQAPVDRRHWPRQGQPVEVLRPAAQLQTGIDDIGSEMSPSDYVAAPTGLITTVNKPFEPDNLRVTLATAATFTTGPQKDLPVAFLRVWEEEIAFTPGTSVTLTATGIVVNIVGIGNQDSLHVGDYWVIGVRPGNPTLIYPERLKDKAQVANGPRRWACPLAIVQWQANGSLKVLEDCRNKFDNLVDLTKRKVGSGCCDLTVAPGDLAGELTLQKIIDGFTARQQVNLCLMPGTYNLTEPLRIDEEHSNLTIEGCRDGVVIQVKPGSEANFTDGMFVLCRTNNVTLRGLRFELPQAPFAAVNPSFKRMFENLRSSVGVRALHCALLTIDRCLFRFSLSAGDAVFGAGVMANSECWGLQVRGCRFLHEERYLKEPAEVRLLFGYLLTPSTKMKATRDAVLTFASRTPAAAVIPALLNDAVFEDNEFSGITGACLVYSVLGAISVRENTVRDCEFGFVILAPTAFLFSSLAGRLLVSQEKSAGLSGFYQAMAGVGMTQAIQLAVALGQFYPIPEGCLIDIPVAVKTPAPTMTTVLVQRLQKVVDTVGTSVTAAMDAPAPRVSGSSKAAPADTPGAKLAGKVDRMISLDKLPVSGTVRVAGNWAVSNLKANQVRAANFHAAMAQHAVLQTVARQGGLKLSLKFSDNAVSVMFPKGDSGSCLLVWPDDSHPETAVIMDGNHLSNRGSMFPAAGLVLVPRAVITGNLVANEMTEGTSLSMFPNLSKGVPGSQVAITGNVLIGPPNLPARNLLPPFNSWRPMNTVG